MQQWQSSCGLLKLGCIAWVINIIICVKYIRSSIWTYYGYLMAVSWLIIIARSVRDFYVTGWTKVPKFQGCFVWMYTSFFSLAAKFKPLFSKWRPKNKNGRQKSITYITGLIIDIQSRVICQNVHYLNRYLIWLQYAILVTPIWPQNSKMAAQNRKTNTTGLVINLQSRVICQNVYFLNINTNTLP